MILKGITNWKLDTLLLMSFLIMTPYTS